MPQHSYTTGIINFRKMIKDEDQCRPRKGEDDGKETEENYNIKSTCE